MLPTLPSSDILTLCNLWDWEFDSFYPHDQVTLYGTADLKTGILSGWA